jgi:uncharacterized membrane protein YbhN (UPF0104 family)
MKMKLVTNALLGVSLAILLALMAAMIFALPTWLIWNHIVADVFELPHLSFWQTFWIMLMIRFIIPAETKTKEKS